ncbi:MAG: hypothetical protein ABSB18_05655 [Candidatus Omnitrophota bacterium]
MQNKSFTAFPSTESNLKELIARIDIERFRKERVPACSFLSKNCIGMCCSLPVAVTLEEAEVLTRLVKDKTKVFRKMRLKIRGAVITIDATTQRMCLSKKRRSFLQLNKIIYNLMNKDKKMRAFDFKVFLGFIRTCVFSMADGSCALQRLSEQQGLHRWYYKPFNCWKYPLSINKGYLTLPERLGNAQFPCHGDKNISSYEGLREELLFLGKIMERDILKEIEATR